MDANTGAVSVPPVFVVVAELLSVEILNVDDATEGADSMATIDTRRTSLDGVLLLVWLRRFSLLPDN
jgi:hypothetical protein